jgi:hypothetical protein
MNTELLLIIIVISWAINGVFKILLGAVGAEKSRTYDLSDVIIGLLDLGLVVWVWFG